MAAGMRISSVALVLYLAHALPAAAAGLSLITGDSERGKAVFRAWNCGTCHSVNGVGGGRAPDLGRPAERDFGPSEMAGRLWSHAPVMWAAMERAGIRTPELEEQDGADLFVYLFAARSFEAPGNAGRGKRIFRQKRCDLCHGSAPAHGALPLNAWNSVSEPVALVQGMWNHSSEMKRALTRAGAAWPRLSAQELRDILTYVRGVNAASGSADFSPGPQASGQELFVSKGCAGCHKGSLKLETRSTRYGVTELAAAMWNHAFRVPGEPARFSHDEMRRLVGYLVSIQFYEERGDSEQGKRLFEKKRCASCHDNAESGAPARSRMAGKMNSYGLATALWKHGPVMLARMKQTNIPWPQFSGNDVADLTAYLHGAQLKKR
jgi:mono/diheme cytochrome c family protein